MAQRRMFSPDIVESDAFLDMPTSSQALYFHLGMYADDDGFVNPKRVMRILGVSEDDMKILIGKRFVLPFESGVVVIKHWRINNLVRKDWYKETRYLEEKKTLKIKDNNSYTELVNETTPGSLTQVRLGKVRLGKDNIDNEEGTSPSGIPLIIKAFEKINPACKKYYGNKTQRKACEDLIENYGLDRVLLVVEETLPKTNDMEFFPTITTPLQLQDKWASLESAIRKYQEKNIKKSNVAFI